MMRRNPTVNILSVNVGRCSATHQITLETAFSTNVDILLIQEPYIYKNLTRRITRHHPCFETFSPSDDWATRPRVMTYGRKGNGLIYSQERPLLIHNQIGREDVLFLSFNLPDESAISVINTYNAPPGAINPGAGVSLLCSLQISSLYHNTILAGDFNLHHKEWHPSYQGVPSPQADVFIRWLEANGLVVISEIDVPTHNRGNVLDLSFTTNQLLLDGTSSFVQKELDVTSDHLPILISIPCHGVNPSPIPKLRFSTINQEVFISLLRSQLIGITPLSNKTGKNVENRANELVELIYRSFSGSAKMSLPHNKGQPWWDSNCKAAKRQFKSISALRVPSQTEKKAYRKVINQAKASFYRKKLDEASNAKDAFEISKWHKSKGQFRMPPLFDPLRPEIAPAQTPEGKRRILIENLLCNQTGAGDIPASTPTVPSTSIPFPQITEFEVSQAVLGAGNTTPGKDGISTAILRLAWPQISSLVLDLFQACVEIGYHPHCFRVAILAIIEKPNKIDKSSPRSYRPIALLSVLGKGLERLIAKRMSWIVITKRILRSQQFGALPLRSSVDLTTCLTHDVEDALAKGWTATVATLDVKGAFDAVLPGRLFLRLREQGWPFQLCNWVLSFVTDRKVCIRLDGQLGPQQSIKCGLPQGSPVSPILFMLYISPLFKIDGMRKSFGYADDVAILETSPSLEENSARIGTTINRALDWGKSEGVTFDPSKSELIHFSRKRKDKNNNPPVLTNEFPITANLKQPYVKWLGIHFDRKLTFKEHACIQAAKALRVVKALRSMGNTERGVSPLLTRQVICSCALSIAHFGSTTWWPGKTRLQGRQTVSNRVGIHLKMIDKVYTAAARVILPVFRTTPTAVLLRESGLAPAEITLESLSRKAAIRTRKLDPYHPLYRRIHSHSLNPAKSRYIRAVQGVPSSEEINPLYIPPWEKTSLSSITFPQTTASTIPRTNTLEKFKYFLETIPKNDIVLFTDGSKSNSGCVGFGFVIFQMGRQVCKGSRQLGKLNEIYDAEVHAVLYGIKTVIDLPTARFANDLWILLDNYSVVSGLTRNTTPKSSQVIFAEITEAVKLWKSRKRLPHTRTGMVRIHWIPGHSGIKGNEIADREAKKATSTLNPVLDCKRSFASLEQWHKTKSNQVRETWWKEHAPKTYIQLEINDAPPIPKELLLRRKALGKIIAARTGHGDFAAYHNRFGHMNAKIHCQCGSLKTPTHFFYCRKVRRRSRYRPPGSINSLLPNLLGTPEGAFKLVKWLENTKYFEQICLR